MLEKQRRQVILWSVITGGGGLSRDRLEDSELLITIPEKENPVLCMLYKLNICL